MTQPRRLMERGADAFERELLRSAARDAPSKRAQHRALAALGLGAGTAVGTGASSTAAAAGSVAAGSAAGSTILKVGGAVFVKWVGVGLVMTGAVAGGAYYVTRADVTARQVAPGVLPAATSTPPAATPVPGPYIPRRQAPNMPATPAALPDTPAPPPSAGRPPLRSSVVAASAPTQIPKQAAAATLSPPVPQPAALPIAVAPPPVESAIPAPTREPPVAAPATALSPLAAETALIDAARGAVRASQPARALRLLDERDRRFPGGAFGEEATVLRIEALVRSGDRATASDLASRFIADHPGSPHADGLRSLTNP